MSTLEVKQKDGMGKVGGGGGGGGEDVEMLSPASSTQIDAGSGDVRAFNQYFRHVMDRSLEGSLKLLII